MPNPIINRRVVLSGNSYSPAAQAYFNVLSVQPSSIQKARLDNYLFRPLVAAGIFTELDRLWIFASEIQANGLISLVNPTSTAASEVNTPTWTQYQGYTGNAATSYINTNYNPATAGVKYTQNSASFGSYSRTNSAGNFIEIGANVGGFGGFVNCRTAGDRFNCGINSPAINIGTVANTSSLGLSSALRTISTESSSVRNGVVLETWVETATALYSANFFICCRNFGGTPTNLSARQVSAGFIGSGNFSHLTLYNIIQGYMTQIGSAV